MRHERVELDEAVPIEEQVQALTRGQLALLVLLLDASLPAAQPGLLAKIPEPLDVCLVIGQRDEPSCIE